MSYLIRVDTVNASIFSLQEEANSQMILNSEPGQRLSHIWGEPHIEPVEQHVSDFASYGVSYSIILSEKAARILDPLISERAELLPVQSNKEKFYIINVLEILDCIDEERSTIERWSSTGRIKRAKPLFFKEGCADDKHIFLLKDWEGHGIYVSDQFKQAVEENKLEGLIFYPIGDQSAK